MLIPKKKRGHRAKKELPLWEKLDVQKFKVLSSAAATRKWAKMTGDFNLIHIHSLLARLFGQKGQICHGFWSMAQTLSVLEGEQEINVKQAKVEWKKPFYCGDLAEGQYHLNEDGKSGEMMLLVADVKTKLYEVPHMLGTFEF